MYDARLPTKKLHEFPEKTSECRVGRVLLQYVKRICIHLTILYSTFLTPRRGVTSREFFFSLKKEISSFHIKNLLPRAEGEKGSLWLAKGIPLSRGVGGMGNCTYNFFSSGLPSFLRNFSRFSLDAVRISRHRRLRIHVETAWTARVLCMFVGQCIRVRVYMCGLCDGENQSSRTERSPTCTHTCATATPFRIFSRFFLADPHPKQNNVGGSLRSW